MIEIKPSNLQINQTYYIEMPTRRSMGALPSKIKAICKGKMPANGHIPKYVKFDIYKSITSTEIDYNIGSCAFMNYRSYKYYLPTKDAILRRKEGAIVNAVLRHITGDPGFTYYVV
jgi:hypothetical protein